MNNAMTTRKPALNPLFRAYSHAEVREAYATQFRITGAMLEPGAFGVDLRAWELAVQYTGELWTELRAREERAELPQGLASGW